jgi:NADH-quinone oxidoreductase subunit J
LQIADFKFQIAQILGFPIYNLQSSICNYLMSAFLFWVFALMLLVFGGAVIINRNPVASALSLVVSFLALAALFISLDAYFVGIIQVLVYAGAIMVLFLFIIMLLDLRAEELRKINWIASAGGVAVALALIVQIFSVVGSFRASKQPFPPLARPVLSGVEGSTSDDVHRIGLLLFGNYNLPFQIIGIIILVATIGVVMLSRRESR